MPCLGLVEALLPNTRVLPKTGWFPNPEGVSFEQAAAVPVAGLTALQGLRDKGHLQQGQKVLINGAAGGIRTFAVQIARSLGADVTGVCSTNNIELVRSLDAGRIIDYTGSDFTQDNERYDLLLDNVGNRTLSEMRRVLGPNGKCAMAGAPKDLWAVLMRVLKAFAWSPFLKQKFTFSIAKMKRDDLMTLSSLIGVRTVTPVIDRCYPLNEAAAAIAYVEGLHARAKVVITFPQSGQWCHDGCETVGPCAGSCRAAESESPAVPRRLLPAFRVSPFGKFS